MWKEGLAWTILDTVQKTYRDQLGKHVRVKFAHKRTLACIDGHPRGHTTR